MFQQNKQKKRTPSSNFKNKKQNKKLYFKSLKKINSLNLVIFKQQIKQY